MNNNSGPGFMNFKNGLILAYLILTQSSLWSAEGLDSLKTPDHQYWAALPALGYTEETGFEIGAVGFYFPYDIAQQKSSSIGLVAYGTTKKQMHLKFYPDMYFQEGHYHLKSSLDYKIWPANYYGLGNWSQESDQLSFDQQIISGYFLLEQKVTQVFYAGGGIFAKSTQVEWGSTPKSLVEQIPGSSGEFLLAPAVSLVLEGREHVNWPRRGYYAKNESHYYAEALGSSASFFRNELELATFIPVLEQQVVALAVGWSARLGDVPFDEMATADGSSRLRGIEKGRYRDKHLVSWQAEARTPLLWRLGGALFVEGAQVAPNPEKFRFEDFHYALGMGGRFALNKEQRFNVRGDITWIFDRRSGFGGGTPGLVIDVKEAF
jgi:hypothetical protein